MADVASGWCEIVPIFGSKFRAIVGGFNPTSLHALPVIEIHPITAVVFNHFLLRYFRRRCPTCSLNRLHQKNDKLFIEENNHSLFRAYLGYSRFDTLALTGPPTLYDQLWLYHNLFNP